MLPLANHVLHDSWQHRHITHHLQNGEGKAQASDIACLRQLTRTIVDARHAGLATCNDKKRSSRLLLGTSMIPMRSNVRRSTNIVSRLFLHPSCDTVKRRAWLSLHGMAIRSSITKTWTMGLTFRRSVLMDEFLNTGAIKTDCGSRLMLGLRVEASPGDLALPLPSMSETPVNRNRDGQFPEPCASFLGRASRVSSQIAANSIMTTANPKSPVMLLGSRCQR